MRTYIFRFGPVLLTILGSSVFGEVLSSQQIDQQKKLPGEFQELEKHFNAFGMDFKDAERLLKDLLRPQSRVISCVEKIVGSRASSSQGATPLPRFRKYLAVLHSLGVETKIENEKWPAFYVDEVAPGGEDFLWVATEFQKTDRGESRERMRLVAGEKAKAEFENLSIEAFARLSLFSAGKDAVQKEEKGAYSVGAGSHSLPGGQKISVEQSPFGVLRLRVEHVGLLEELLLQTYCQSVGDTPAINIPQGTYIDKNVVLGSQTGGWQTKIETSVNTLSVVNFSHGEDAAPVASFSLSQATPFHTRLAGSAFRSQISWKIVLLGPDGGVIHGTDLKKDATKLGFTVVPGGIEIQGVGQDGKKLLDVVSICDRSGRVIIASKAGKPFALGRLQLSAEDFARCRTSPMFLAGISATLIALDEFYSKSSLQGVPKEDFATIIAMIDRGAYSSRASLISSYSEKNLRQLSLDQIFRLAEMLPGNSDRFLLRYFVANVDAIPRTRDVALFIKSVYSMEVKRELMDAYLKAHVKTLSTREAADLFDKLSASVEDGCLLYFVQHRVDSLNVDDIRRIYREQNSPSNVGAKVLREFFQHHSPTLRVSDAISVADLGTASVETELLLFFIEARKKTLSTEDIIKVGNELYPDSRKDAVFLDFAKQKGVKMSTRDLDALSKAARSSSTASEISRIAIGR